jgi:cytochrome P450
VPFEAAARDVRRVLADVSSRPPAGQSGRMEPAEPLPPGPEVDPLIQGTLFHRDPVGVLSRCQGRYGDVFTLSLPTARRMVVVTDPASVRVVAGTDPALATTGAGRRRLLGPASPRSVLGADGDWHRVARTTVGPAFTPQALEPHREAMAALAAQHVARWPRQRPFRLLPRVKTLADDVFVRFALGVRDERRSAALVAAIRYMLLSPGTPPMPITSGDRGVLGVLGERLYRRRREPVERLLMEELRERRSRGVPSGGELDVLSCLLRAENPSRSHAEIVEEVVPLLMAAQEPAAVGLTWLLDRAAREGDAAGRLAPGRDAWSDAFVDESMRLRPAVHTLVRPLTAPLAVAGYELPPGVVLAVPIPLLHRDRRVFDGPDRFRPERFLEQPAPDTFLPFGTGARRCLGQALATLQAQTLVPAVLSRLRLTPLSRRPERQIVRATVLPPHRSALMIARDR